MLSIGEFSKICKVSTKTLRYYAEIDLITPKEINTENGYRHYSIDQLETMLLINRLKAYEFSLEEIKEVLKSEKYSLEESLLFQLNKKKGEMEEKISAYEMTLQQISKDIFSLQKGNSLLTYLKSIDAQLIEVEPMYILSIRKLVSMQECAKGYDQFFSVLYRWIAKDGLTIIGPPMTIYHSEEYLLEGYDIEFAIPIREYATATKDFTPGLCLKTSLKGPYSELTSVYAKQREWIEKENYVVTKPPFDIYITNPYEIMKPEESITEVYLPVMKK